MSNISYSYLFTDSIMVTTLSMFVINHMKSEISWTRTYQANKTDTVTSTWSQKLGMKVYSLNGGYQQAEFERFHFVQSMKKSQH